MGRGKAAEIGYQGAHGEVPFGHDALDANGKGIARFGTLHEDGSRLGVEELGRGKRTARKVVLLRYPALEGIIRMYGHPFSRLHRCHRFPIRVEDVAIILRHHLHRSSFVRLHRHSSWRCSPDYFPVARTGAGSVILATFDGSRANG